MCRSGATKSQRCAVGKRLAMRCRFASRRRTADEVARLLREADRDLAKGLTVSDICRKIGIAEMTYYRRQQHDPEQVDADRRCRELEVGGLRGVWAGFRFSGNGGGLPRSRHGADGSQEAQSARRMRLRTLSGWGSPKAADKSRSVTGVNSRAN